MVEGRKLLYFGTVIYAPEKAFFNVKLTGIARGIASHNLSIRVLLMHAIANRGAATDLNSETEYA